MVQILEAIGLIILCSVCDRLRGGWQIVPTTGHKIAGLSYGIFLGLLLDVPLIWLPVLALLWWLGEKPGWGYPMGQAVLGKIQHAYSHPNAKSEKWQVSPLKNHPWLSLVVRGAMWALPCLALYHWLPQVTVLFGMAVAMPLGALFDRFTRNRLKAGEFVRGALIGIICALY